MTDSNDGGMIVWEDVFEVWKRIGDACVRKIASDMDLYDALLFMRAWMEENFQDQRSSLELRRQQIEEPKGADNG